MTALRSVTRKLFDRLHDETVDTAADYVVAPSSFEDAADVLAAAADAGDALRFRPAAELAGPALCSSRTYLLDQ